MTLVFQVHRNNRWVISTNVCNFWVIVSLLLH